MLIFVPVRTFTMDYWSSSCRVCWTRSSTPDKPMYLKSGRCLLLHFARIVQELTGICMQDSCKILQNTIKRTLLVRMHKFLQCKIISTE